MKIVPIAALALTLVTCVGTAYAAAIGEEEGKAIAKKLVDDLSTGSFTAADAAMDTKVKKALGDQGSAGMWRVVTAKVGPLKQCEQPRSAMQGEMRAFVFPCEFAAAKLDVLVVVMPDSKVGGFHLAPPADATPSKPATDPAKDEAKKD